jgi:D-3-phosphoglycerate dehydrogenase
MFNIWFEWEPPAEILALIQGRATTLGPAAQSPEQPWSDLAAAEGIVAAADLQYSDDVLALAPNLRVISRIGVGCDNIDLAAASRRGIAVCNAPDAPTISTAEHAIALMLAVAKQIPSLEAQLKRGDRPNYFLENRGLELSGRIFGVVGFGRIGRRVARLARGLDMEVVGYDPHANEGDFVQNDVVRCATLNELLKIADVVTLHVPLNDQTRGLFDRQRLESMKPGSILINTARGGLIGEAALLAVLQSGHLFGAGLDVFRSEPPPPDDPLLNCDRIVATPHVASATEASKLRLWTTAVSQALDVLDDREPAHQINAGPR